MLRKRVLFAGAAALALSLVSMQAQAETLREALTNAYRTNPNIASAQLAVKSSAENIVIAKSGKLPQIGASATYNNSWSIGGPTGDFSSSNTFQVGASYNQNLFDNFSTEASIEQSRAMAEVARFALANAEQNVLLSVVDAFMSVIRDTQLVSLRSESVSFYQAQVRSAQDRLDIGEGTRLDVSQAQARLSQATASYRAAMGNLQISQASYQRWVGRPPQGLVADFSYNNLMPTSIDAAVRASEANHPAIMSAKAMIRASQAGADAAQAAFGPTLDLIGQICAFNCSGAGTTGMTGSVRLQLSIPIYTGGRLGAQVRQANLEQVSSEVDAMSTRDQIRESVITAWSTLQNANAQIESAQATVSAGRQVLEGIIQERDVGQRTTLDVLNSQAELTTAQETLISAQASRVIASFSLIAATGRMQATDLGLPVRVDTGERYIQTVEDVWQELRAVAD